MNNVLITGKSIYLKEPKLNDYERIKNIWEDKDTMKDVGGPILLSKNKYNKWYEGMIIKGKVRNKYFLIIDKVSGNCLGEISFHRYNFKSKTAELNVKIIKKYRGQGKGREALDIFLDYYFNIFKGLVIQDNIAVNNKNGLDILIKYGFIEINRNLEEILIQLPKSKYKEIKPESNAAFT